MGAPDMIPYFTGPGAMGLIDRNELGGGIDYNAYVATLSDLTQYDEEPEDFAVLVIDNGDERSAIYIKNSDTSGDWSSPVYVSGPRGRPAPEALQYRKSDTTTEGDPGSGNFRFNDADPAAATAIYLDNITIDGNSIADLIT